MSQRLRYYLFLPGNLKSLLEKHGKSLLDLAVLNLNPTDRWQCLRLSINELPIADYDKELILAQIEHGLRLTHLHTVPTIQKHTIGHELGRTTIELLDNLDKSLLPYDHTYKIESIGDYLVVWLYRNIWKTMGQATHKFHLLKDICNAIIRHRGRYTDAIESPFFVPMLKLYDTKGCDIM